jgi:DNA-binding protein H-NS
MTKAQELKELLIEDVIPDIEDYMDDLFTLIADKKATADDKAELEEMRELKSEFHTMLEDLEKNEIDEDECIEIIAELEEMMKDEFED